jgi:hypothetical protein
MKYNNETLVEYCKTNNIVLLKNYEKIKRESYIEGKCTYENCENNFNKNFRQLVKTGAYCVGCMTTIATNKIRNSSVKYDVNMLNAFCNENNILLTEDYSNQFINRNSIIEGMCKTIDCENVFSKPFRELLKINGYCPHCSKENGKIKIKNTSLKKYGADCCLKNKDIREKINKTTLAKYGVKHNSQLERIKQQKRDKSIEKFGTNYVLQSLEIRNQIKQTNLQKYGCGNPQQNEVIKNKTYETNLKKYGVKHFVKTPEFKNKTVKTNLERYGVPHHSQNAEISEKMIKNAYNKKPYILPSGNIIFIQGYENFMLDYLLSVENVDEDDIFTKRNEVPEIWYNDKTEKRCRHYVDFYIKSQNRCIEVKSTFTNQSKNNVFEKQKAAKDLGLKYEIWIFNREGELLDKYI